MKASFSGSAGCRGDRGRGRRSGIQVEVGHGRATSFINILHKTPRRVRLLLSSFLQIQDPQPRLGFSLACNCNAMPSSIISMGSSRAAASKMLDRLGPKPYEIHLPYSCHSNNELCFRSGSARQISTTGFMIIQSDVLHEVEAVREYHDCPRAKAVLASPFTICTGSAVKAGRLLYLCRTSGHMATEKQRASHSCPQA